MILGFKQQFRDKTPTNFKEKILSGEKIHSIREDINHRWKSGMMIHMAYGVRTKNYEQFNKEQCMFVQRIFMTCDWRLEITIDGRYLMPWEVDTLIKNDGLTREQFIKWFFPEDVNEYSGRIIHWTDFKY